MGREEGPDDAPPRLAAGRVVAKQGSCARDQRFTGFEERRDLGVGLEVDARAITQSIALLVGGCLAGGNAIGDRSGIANRGLGRFIGAVRHGLVPGVVLHRPSV